MHVCYHRRRCYYVQGILGEAEVQCETGVFWCRPDAVSNGGRCGSVLNTIRNSDVYLFTVVQIKDGHNQIWTKGAARLWQNQQNGVPYKQLKEATIGPPVKRHSNGVRWWVDKGPRLHAGWRTHNQLEAGHYRPVSETSFEFEWRFADGRIVERACMLDGCTPSPDSD